MQEEYTYGSTAQSVRADIEVPLKRYRYTGKERDEECGFYYHGARYYAPWLGRWVASDPLGITDGINIYWFSLDNPIRFLDPNGKQGVCNEGDWLCAVGEVIVGESEDPILSGITDTFARRGEGMYNATVGVVEKFSEGDIIGGAEGVKDLYLALLQWGFISIWPGKGICGAIRCGNFW
jgi:RHS repeat-associated protein